MSVWVRMDKLRDNGWGPYAAYPTHEEATYEADAMRDAGHTVRLTDTAVTIGFTDVHYIPPPCYRLTEHGEPCHDCQVDFIDDLTPAAFSVGDRVRFRAERAARNRIGQYPAPEGAMAEVRDIPAHDEWPGKIDVVWMDRRSGMRDGLWSSWMFLPHHRQDDLFMFL